MAFYGLGHLIHRAVDGRVIGLEPIVSVPPNEEPDVLLPEEPLLVHLGAERGQGGGFVSFSVLIPLTPSSLLGIREEQRTEKRNLQVLEGAAEGQLLLRLSSSPASQER